jgi:hypothetical protein
MQTRRVRVVCERLTPARSREAVYGIAVLFLCNFPLLDHQSARAA